MGVNPNKTGIFERSFFWVRGQLEMSKSPKNIKQENVKKSEKLMKIVDIDGENLHIF